MTTATERVQASRKRHPEKYAARTALTYAVRSGRILKQPCLVCGSEKAEAHHPDYSKPLDVEWLCREHHKDVHKKPENPEKPREIKPGKPAKDRSKSRHKPGYFTEYMRAYRAKKKMQSD